MGKKKIVSIIFKSITAILCLVGLLLASGAFAEEWNPRFIFYYTNQSNMLCLISMVLCIITGIKDIRKNGTEGNFTFAPRFKGAVVLAITVTFLVYWGMLYQPGEPVTAHSLLLHLIVPVLIIFDWLLFDEKGKYKKLDPVLWLIIPLVYDIFANIVAVTGPARFGESYFPYFFLDYKQNGLGVTALYFVGLLVGFLVLGYVYYGLSQFLSRKQRKQIKE